MNPAFSGPYEVKSSATGEVLQQGTVRLPPHEAGLPVELTFEPKLKLKAGVSVTYTLKYPAD